MIDLIFFYVKFKETLAPEKRLASLEAALKQACTYINPVSLFNFESLDNLKDDEKASLKTIGRTYFLYLFLYSGLEFTLTFLTHLRFNFTSMDQGKMFLFIGVLMALAQGGYVRRIPPGKEKVMVLRGLLLIVPSFAIVGFAQSKPMLYLGKQKIIIFHFQKLRPDAQCAPVLCSYQYSKCIVSNVSRHFNRRAREIWRHACLDKANL